MVNIETRKKSALSFVVLTVAAASSVSMIGGLGIEAVESKLLPIIPLVIALPALNTMVGDYATVIAAHAGNPVERDKTFRKLALAISKSVLVNIILMISLGTTLAIMRNYEFTVSIFIKYALFIGSSISLTVAFMFFITIAIDRLLKYKKINPDDVLIPVVTSISDVLMLGLIALATFFF
ncbi:magnesium transporter [Candidatus Saccharibacteria bacterium CPR2]|nr:magnesium transporter [Candidatus Saccharibacteria bacterium CPR2]